MESQTVTRVLKSLYRNWFLCLVAFTICAVLAVVLLIHLKSDADYKVALQNYQRASMDRTRDVVDDLEGRFEEIQNALETISALPSVRNIDRHAKDLDADDRTALDLLYEHVHDGVAVSEIYIVDAEFNPERMDPKTGALQEPILMVDGMITDDGDQPDSAHEGDAIPEVEIYEYRAIREQINWFKEHAPLSLDQSKRRLPILTSDEHITCDNTVYKTTRKDSDRAGIVMSMPFYGEDGRLRGVVSAILRTAVLSDYLPARDFALLTPVHGFNILSREEGQQTRSRAAIASRLPDKSLFYSEVLDLSISSPQGRWQLWSGHANDAFTSSAEVQRIEGFRIFASGLVFVLAVGAMIGAFAFKKLQEKEEEARKATIMAEAEASMRWQAQAANAAKSQFLATMSHELRTPLNAIIGFSEMIAEDAEAAGEAALEADAGKIMRAGKHLLHLINDVLDFSKIEAGRIEIELQEFNPTDLANDLVELMRSSAEANGVDLKLSIAPDLGVVYSDAFKLKQCLLNLLSNAIKFTKGGAVSITMGKERAQDSETLSHQGLSPSAEYLVVRVQDTGIGMTPSQLANLFQPFKQADATVTREYGGTGLGLSISLGIARRLGGTITARSEAGKGSTFTLCILAKMDEGVAVPQKASA